MTDPSTRSVGYRYDAASHRTRLTYPDGSYVQYYYDQLGRLTSVSYDSNADDQDPAAEQVASYTYDAHSRRTGISRANNAATAYTYTPTDQLSTLGHTFAGGVTATLGYGYDDSGLRNSLTANDQRFAPLLIGTGTADYAPNNSKSVRHGRQGSPRTTTATAICCSTARAPTPTTRSTA